MNRRELVAAIGAQAALDNKTVDAALRGLVDVVQASIAKGEPVVIAGFAKFARVDRKARMGRNPATGATIRIKASRRARVTPLKGLKDIVAGTVKPPRLTAPAAKKAPVKRAAPAAKRAAPAAKAPAARKAPARKAPAKRATK
ncbi:MAG: HU family DNA-binding protein [Acidimicrobiales bacterium]